MQKLLSLVFNSASSLRALDRQTKMDVFWIALIQCANYLFPFIVTTYLVRVIGVDLYGKTEFATYIILYFITVVNYELHITGTRSFSRIKDNPEKINRLFSVIFTAKTWLLALSTLLFAALLAIWPGRFFNPLFLFTYLIVIGHFFYQPHIYQGLGKVRTLALMNLLIKFISTSLLFLTVRRREDYQMVNLNYSLSYILIGIISYIMALRIFKVKLAWKSMRQTVVLLKDGFYIFLTGGIIAQVTLNLSAILLGFFLSPAILGTYSAALKLIIAFQVMILLPLRQVFFPQLSAAWANSRDKYGHLFKTYVIALSSSTLLVGVGILIFAPFIIRVMYGAYFPQMISCMRAFAFLPFLWAMSTAFINDGLIVTGNDRLVFYIQLSIALANIATLLVTVPRFGLNSVLIVRNILELSAAVAGFLFFKNKVIKQWHNPKNTSIS